MKRRNLLHTGIAAVLLLSTGACEDFKFGNAFLDKPFTTDITIDTVYAHKVYAEQALAEVYRSLPDYLPSGGRLCWGILEGMTDLGDAIKPNGIRSYYTGNVSSSTGDMPYILYEGTSSPSFGMSPMTGIRKGSLALAEQVMSISTKCIIEKCGRVNKWSLDRVLKAVQIQMGMEGEGHDGRGIQKLSGVGFQ
jgi:hypothetical protein